MLLSLVAFVLTAAPASDGPPVAALLSRRAGLSSARALELADQVAHAFEADGLSIAVTPPKASEQLAKRAVKDTASCEGHLDCVAGLGSQLGVGVVVGIELAKVSDEIAMHLVAIRTGATPEKLTEDTLIAGAGAPNLEFAVRPFVSELQKKLAPPVATTAPLAEEKKPAPVLTPSPESVTKEGPPALAPRSKLPVYAAGGGAAVAGGLAIYFLVSASSLKSDVNSSRYTTASGVPASHLTQSEANDKVSSANRDTAVGIASGVVSAGLVALTVHLFSGASR